MSDVEPQDIITPDAVQPNGDNSDPTDEAAIRAAFADRLQGNPADDVWANPVEPEDDELGDEIVPVSNGWLRVTIGGQLFKLDRPSLGELRRLESAREVDSETLDKLQESLKPAAEADLATARAIQDEAITLGDDNVVRKFQLDSQTSALTTKAMARNQILVRRAEDLRESWWRLVFEILSRPKIELPEQTPAWVGDPMLQQHVIDHWRRSPLARGRR